jgi:hypothetical protein
MPYQRLILAFVIASTLLTSPIGLATVSAHDACDFHDQWRTRRDAFFTLGSYRLHAWLVGHDCERTCPDCIWYTGERRFEYGQDSRACDGCAYKNVTRNQVDAARAWVCGTLWFNTTRSNTNAAYLDFFSGWKHYGTCGRQADDSGFWDVPGYARKWYYLSI